MTPWQQRDRRYELAAFRARHADDFGSGSAAICMRSGADGAWYDIGTGGEVHKRKVMRCGDSGKCPVCGPQIRTERALDIEAAVEAARAVGLDVWFLTVTLPHTEADDVGDLLQRMQRMWTDMWGHGTGALTKKEIGFEGQIRALEVTHGNNGWHPHIHALIFCKRRRMDPERVVKLWRSRWKAEGVDSPWRVNVSAQMELVNRTGLGKYLGKINMAWGAGLELARSDLKAGAGLTPPQLLELATTGDVEHIRRWVDFEHATKGTVWIRWSPKLREKAIGWQIEATTRHVEHLEHCHDTDCDEPAHRELLGRPLERQEKTDEEAAAGESVRNLAASWWVPHDVHERFRIAGMLGRLHTMMLCNTADRVGCTLVLPGEDHEHRPKPLSRGDPVGAAP